LQMIRECRPWSCHRRTHWPAIMFRRAREQKLTPVGDLQTLGSNWRGDARHAMGGCFQKLDAGAPACPQRHDSNCGLPVVRGDAVHGASDGDTPSGPERQHAVSRTVADDQYLHGTLAGPMMALSPTSAATSRAAVPCRRGQHERCRRQPGSAIASHRTGQGRTTSARCSAAWAECGRRPGNPKEPAEDELILEPLRQRLEHHSRAHPTTARG
jgi:hypothetical protein